MENNPNGNYTQKAGNGNPFPKRGNIKKNIANELSEYISSLASSSSAGQGTARPREGEAATGLSAAANIRSNKTSL